MGRGGAVPVCGCAMLTHARPSSLPGVQPLAQGGFRGHLTGDYRDTPHLASGDYRGHRDSPHLATVHMHPDPDMHLGQLGQLVHQHQPGSHHHLFTHVLCLFDPCLFLF